VVFALCATTASAQSLPITSATVVVFERWASAVIQHTPGQVDAPLLYVERLTAADRGHLRNGLGLFRDALAKKQRRVSTAAEKDIVDLGHELGAGPGLSAFVERAVMLHGDVAIVSIDRPQAAPINAIDATLVGMSAGRQLLERDGEVVGFRGYDWNWLFARELIALDGSTEGQAFAPDWFHATTSFLMSRRLFGEASLQLAGAERLLPKDARMLFSRGVYAEMQGLPASQVLLTAEDLAMMRGATRGNLMTQSGTASAAGLRPAEQENATAERYLRWALDADPECAEARVRLARLLSVRGRHDEAAVELQRALAAQAASDHADPVVTFFAHLFAGRADRALNRLDSAAAHYHDALALYPGAQSALLGASQVALLRADVDGATTSIHQLDGRAAGVDVRSDPWWIYDIGVGRNAESYLAALWSKALAR